MQSTAFLEHKRKGSGFEDKCWGGNVLRDDVSFIYHLQNAVKTVDAFFSIWLNFIINILVHMSSNEGDFRGWKIFLSPTYTINNTINSTAKVFLFHFFSKSNWFIQNNLYF